MPTAVGLDIGTNSIKVAEVRKTRQGICLTRLGRRATPQGAIRSGVIVRQREVAAEISALVKELKLRPKNVVTAVAGQSVIVRTLLLPPMSREEMAEAVKWEVQEQLPFSVDDGIYDFDVIGEVEDESRGQVQLKVGLVAARKEIVNSYVDTLKLCKIVPRVVDVQPFAIMRSLCMRECGVDILGSAGDPQSFVGADRETVSELTDMGPKRSLDQLPKLDDLEYMDLEALRSLATQLDAGDDILLPRMSGAASSLSEAAAAAETDGLDAGAAEDREACLAVLDIGAGTTDVVVYSGGESTFTRIIPVGGDVITEAIEKTLYCSREEAEELKRRTDWVQGLDLESGEPADPLVVSATESVVRDLAREVRRTIDFYNIEHRERPIDGGVLVGGGSKLAGLVEYLSHQLEIPVVIGDPYARVQVDHRRLDTAFMQDEAPLMAVSVGLAVRGAEDL